MKKKSRKNPRANHLLRTYGITEDQYDSLLSKQDFRCAVCKRHQDEFNKRLAVDHDHKTGIIRGLLCQHCNQYVIGRHRDAELFRGAFEYLSAEFTGWIVPPKKKKRRRRRKK